MINMNKKIPQLIAVSLVTTLVSACTGSTLDKKNVSSADKAVTNHVTNQVNHVTSTTAATSNSVTQAAKKLP